MVEVSEVDGHVVRKRTMENGQQVYMVGAAPQVGTEKSLTSSIAFVPLFPLSNLISGTVNVYRAEIDFGGHLAHCRMLRMKRLGNTHMNS